MLSLNQKVKDGSEPLSYARVKSLLTSLLLFLLLLLLPTQFGLHTWPFFTFVSGQRIDYLSPTFYLTDIFLFFLFLLYAMEFLKSIRWQYLLVFFFLACTVAFSQNALAGWWMFLKLIEFSFFAWFIAHSPSDISLFLLYSFTVDLIFESALAVFQFFHEGSLGGIFYYLGERYYTASTPGIANASVGGTLVLRPYGTFSHPNVLAGYLLIGLLFLFTYFLFSRGRKRYLLFFPLLFGTLALLLTLSRTAILLWGIVIPVALFFRYRFHIKWIVSAIISLCILIAGLSFFPLIRERFFALFTDGEDISVRVQLLQAAIAMIQKHPFLGVGLQNFIFLLPSYTRQTSFLTLQPVHNIFFLIASETGIPGLCFFLLFSVKTFRETICKYTRQPQFFLWVFTGLICVFLIGQVDHYFITLQQGQLLFALLLGSAFHAGHSFS